MKKTKEGNIFIISMTMLVVTVAVLFLIFTDPLSPKSMLLTQNKAVYTRITAATADRSFAIFKEEFNRLFQDNPDIYTNLAYYPENIYYDMLNTTLISQSGPDIVAIDHPAVLGELISLSRFLELRNFYNLTWRFGIGGFISDKAAYCTPPLGIKTYVLYYNRKYFSDVGVDYVPEDFEEFVKLLDRIKKYGCTPVSFGIRDTRCLKNILVHLSFEGKAEEMWQNAVSNFNRIEPYLSSEMHLYDFDDALLQFKDGKSAVFFGVSTDIEEMKEDCDFDVGALYLYKSNKKTIWFDYAGIYAVNAKTQNNFHTLKIAQYLASDDAFKYYQEFISKSTPKSVTNAEYRCNWFYDNDGANLRRYMLELSKLQKELMS